MAIFCKLILALSAELATVKRKRSLLTISAIVLVSFTSYSQLSIKGRVIDKENHPLKYATVVAIKDSVFQAAAIADSTGHYTFMVATPGIYKILFSFANYEEKHLEINLIADTILNASLERAGKVLQEVLVSRKKTIIEKKIDRIIFTPSRMTAVAGDNAYEVLKKAPSVNADENGNISIRGLPGSGVMINGRLLHLDGEQVMEYLKSIPVENVKSIEIITNPSSKYDAEGLSGLINIVLEKDQTRGLNGNANVNFAQTRYSKAGANMELNYRSRVLNLFGGSSVRSGRYFLREDVDNIYSRSTSPYLFYENGRRIRNENSIFNKFGLDYFIDSMNVIGVRVEQGYSSRNGSQQNESLFQGQKQRIDSLYHTDILLKNYNRKISANINYTRTLDAKGSFLSFDADYFEYKQPQLKTSTQTLRYDSSWHTLTPNIFFNNQAAEKITLQSVKGDFTKVLDNGLKFECGSKYYVLRSKNDLEFYDFLNDTWVFDLQKSGLYKYKESNIAFYSNLYKEFNKKWSSQIGIRTERTSNSGSASTDTSVVQANNYFKLFPSIFVQYSRNDNNQFSISLTRRINRPNYASLSPFRYYLTPNNYIEGNPFLSPAFTNSIDLSYTLKQKYYFDLFLYLTDGQITQIPILNGSNNTYKYTSVNLKHSYNVGVNCYLPFTFSQWWSGSFYLSGGLNGVHTLMAGNDYTYRNINFLVSTNHQLAICSKHNFYGEVNFVYQPPGMSQGLFILGQILDMSIGLKKSFKSNKITTSLNFTDVFNSTYVTAKVDKAEEYSFIHGNYDKRGISLSVSYKFGRLSVKGARTKNSVIEEETNRIKQ